MPALCRHDHRACQSALVCLVNEIANTPGCRVLSATTDGCMVVVPRIFAPEMVDGVCKPIEDVAPILGDIYDRLKRNYPIFALEQGRLNMDNRQTVGLKLSTLGDRALTIKTRMNVLTYRGVLQHQARGGIRLADGDSFDRFFRVVVILMAWIAMSGTGCPP